MGKRRRDEGGRQGNDEQWFDLSYKLVDNPNDTTTWREISDIVDIDEYCNYMAAEIYIWATSIGCVAD